MRTAIFLFLACVRCLSVVVSQIPDCDEVFNYWEPLHFLMYGSGLQTWEYAPQYALRSYAYLLPHALPAWVADSLMGLVGDQENKVFVFYSLRFALVLLSSACEAYLVDAVMQAYSRRIGSFLAFFLAFTPGMFFAAPTLLPSTFTMYTLMISCGAWIRRKYNVALTAAAVGVLLSCWPYVGVVYVPLGLEALLRRPPAAVVGWCVILVVMITAPIVFIDTHYYGEPTLAAWNIFSYNVMNAKAHLYGVEPWHYYPKNLFLNFNIGSALCMAGLMVPALDAMVFGCRKHATSALQILTHLSPLLSWGVVMQTRPHKEERFLYFVYPLICLSAAIGLDALMRYCVIVFRGVLRVVGRMAPETRISVGKGVSRVGCLAIMVVFQLLSGARIVAVIKNYSAPMSVYKHLYDKELVQRWGQLLHAPPGTKSTVNVCVGKEWYRFPSHFFLRPWARLRFLRSGFTGQLPREYPERWNGTWSVAPHMNDDNEEETSRYVSPSECHYIVDLDLGPGSASERDPRYTDVQHASQWEILYTSPFLDAANSHSIARAFFIPFGWSVRRTSFLRYMLLRNRKLDTPLAVTFGLDGAAGVDGLSDGAISRSSKAEELPDIIGTTEGPILTTRAGKSGYWNRDVARSFPDLLFVYGENHRDFLKLDASVDPVTGRLAVNGRTHRQEKTQANIRGEPNAFPVRTVWYHHLPNGHAYKNFMTDDDFHDNRLLIQHDLDLIHRAWLSGGYRAVVFPHDGLGTGVADLPRRAPRTYQYLNEELGRLKQGIAAVDPASSRAHHAEELVKRQEAVAANHHTVHEDEL